MLIHTALTNGHIPPVRGVTGLPGAMSGCGATCTSRGLPGVVGISESGAEVMREGTRGEMTRGVNVATRVQGPAPGRLGPGNGSKRP